MRGGIRCCCRISVRSSIVIQIPLNSILDYIYMYSLYLLSLNLSCIFKLSTVVTPCRRCHQSNPSNATLLRDRQRSRQSRTVTNRTHVQTSTIPPQQYLIEQLRAEAVSKQPQQYTQHGLPPGSAGSQSLHGYHRLKSTVGTLQQYLYYPTVVAIVSNINNCINISILHHRVI